MRIVYFIPSLGLAGAEKQVCTLAIQAKKDQHDVTVITLFETKGFQYLLKEYDVNYICLDLKNLISFPAVICQFQRLINQISPNVIHSHMFLCILIVRALRFYKTSKLFETIHCNPEEIKAFTFTFLRLTKSLSYLTTSVGKQTVLFANKKKL